MSYSSIFHPLHKGHVQGSISNARGTFEPKNHASSHLQPQNLAKNVTWVAKKQPKIYCFAIFAKRQIKPLITVDHGRCCNNTLPRGGVYWKIRPLRQFAPRGLRDCPRAILGAEGCKLPRGAYFPIHPDSRQCIVILFSRAGVYWKLPFQQPECIDSI